MKITIDKLKKRWHPYKKSRWRYLQGAVNGHLAPIEIVDDNIKVNNVIVHRENGLAHGASEWRSSVLVQNAEAITNAPYDVNVLLIALDIACGGSEDKIKFALKHAEKNLMIEREEIKSDTSIRDYR